MVQSDSCANVLPQCGTEVLSDLKQVRFPRFQLVIGCMTDGSSLCESVQSLHCKPLSAHPASTNGRGCGITCNWQTAQYPVSSRLERKR